MNRLRKALLLAGIMCLALGFALGAHAQNPGALVWSTFLGGGGDEFGSDITVTAAGEAIVVGYTNSTDFPTTAGAYDTTANGDYDVFVTKLNSDGSGLVFSTLLGGSGYDEGGSITYDSSGDVYVVGVSASTDFPIQLGNATNAGGSDLVLIRLSSSGGLLYSTYIGGSGNESSWEEGCVKVDGAGDIVITGMSSSPDYPAVNAAQPLFGGGADDACVTKVSGTTGAILFSTYLGGAVVDRAFAVCTDSTNQVYVTGRTTSNDFPTTVGAYQTTRSGSGGDAFVTVLSSTGALTYSTYIGGPGNDDAWSMVVVAPMDIYITGRASAGFPTTAGAYQTTNAGGFDGYVAELTASGLTASTFVGGTGAENTLSMATDSSGNVWISGETTSTDYPVTSGAYQVTYGGGANDVVVARLNNTLSTLSYATYLGGSARDWSGHIDVDASGVVYIESGNTYSSDFPVTTGAFDTTYGGDGVGVADTAVTALNPDGTLDTDGDGIPDSWELSHGLDRHANDANLDPDNDGLTNVDEYAENTHPFDNDCDNDGLLDGDEANAYLTDPLAADSDGDGYSDEAEIKAGTDPLDSGSIPPRPAPENPDQLLWATYLGGWAFDQATAVTADATGAVFVAGSTRESSVEDGYFAKVSSDGTTQVFRQVLGGADSDAIYDIVLDASGNIYVAGRTSSADFPTTSGAADETYNGNGDLFVAKFDPTGTTLLFSAFVGGGGLDATYEDCLTMDASGDLYLTGQTFSGDFPVTPGAFDTTFNGAGDSFVVKLAADGSHIVYATYLGGSGLDNTRGIAVNGAGEAYLKGFTASGDFPTVAGGYSTTNHGGQDFFVTKVDAAGATLLYSTYLGGSANEGSSYGSLVLNASGEVIVSGFTESPDFPATPGAFDSGFNGVRDGFVAKLGTSGQLLAATFLGGRKSDGGNEIRLDASGDLWWTTTVGSDNFPTTPGAYLSRLGGSSQTSDIALACLDGNLSQLKYCTFLGGPDAAETFLVLDPTSNAVYVWAGVYAYLGYPEFPTTPGAYDTSYNGDRDGYLVKIDPTIHMGDTDGDGMPDWWELFYSLNPNADDANQDADSDGVNNLQEYQENRNPSSPQSKYRLGPATELLNAAFYAGEASDGSNVAGRWAYFGRAASDNKTVVFWAANIATNQYGLFLVDVGDPSSWRRLTVDMGGMAPVSWTPDNHYVMANGYRIPVDTGDLIPHSVHGYPVTAGGVAMTQYPSQNWIVVYPPPNQANGDLVYVPILNNGDEDLARQPVMITNMFQNGNEAQWHDVSSDGSSVAFQAAFFTSPRPYDSDVYVLRDVPSILSAPKIPLTDISSLAPTSLADPRFAAIRTTETENAAGYPYVSADGNQVIYSEESSRLVRRGTDVLAVLFRSDWDVVISNIDGSGDDFKLAEPGNQAVVIPTPGGMRLLYIQEVGNEMHLLVSTLDVKNDVGGTPVGPPENNDIITTTEQTASDASGTTMTIPTGTTVNFPEGAPQAIQITTPIDPATEPQLPPNVEAIPVIREFGPSGTTFDTPVTVTISYTDAEVAGLDEAHLRIFQYNPGTGVYDLEVTTIVSRDLANNTVSFTVTHFSTYGLGGKSFPVDVDGNGVVNATDLQLTINAALGLDIGSFDADVNGDTMKDAIDVQLLIIRLLGL